jgi:hypothetical protein
VKNENLAQKKTKKTKFNLTHLMTLKKVKWIGKTWPRRGNRRALFFTNRNEEMRELKKKFIRIKNRRRSRTFKINLNISKQFKIPLKNG